MTLFNWFKGNFKKVVTHKNPVKFLMVHSFKKIIRIISTRYPHFLDIVPIIYKKGNFNLRLAPTLLSYVMYEYEYVREEDEKFIAKLLDKGDVYIDVGANVGNTTLSAAFGVGDVGCVYSFEAHPRTYRYLLGSIACNKKLISRIKTKNVALGEKQGEVFFTDLQNDDINKVSNSGKIKVKMETLDEQNFPEKIKLLKIDVEGYELFVLQGAKKTLQKTDIVIFESFIKNYQVFNVNLIDIIKLLKDSGFSLYKIEENIISNIEDDYVSHDCEDLIAIRDIKLLLDKGFLLDNNK